MSIRHARGTVGELYTHPHKNHNKIRYIGSNFGSAHRDMRFDQCHSPAGPGVGLGAGTGLSATGCGTGGCGAAAGAAAGGGGGGEQAGRLNSANLWVPVNAAGATARNGAMRVLPVSWDPWFARPGAPEHMASDGREAASPGVRVLAAGPGAAVLWKPCLLHWWGPHCPPLRPPPPPPLGPSACPAQRNTPHTGRVRIECVFHGKSVVCVHARPGHAPGVVHAPRARPTLGPAWQPPSAALLHRALCSAQSRPRTGAAAAAAAAAAVVPGVRPRTLLPPPPPRRARRLYLGRRWARVCPCGGGSRTPPRPCWRTATGTPACPASTSGTAAWMTATAREGRARGAPAR